MKLYKCCICHKQLDRYEVVRLVKELYGIGSYNQFATEKHFDLCNECYDKFDKWIIKHKEVGNEKRVV